MRSYRQTTWETNKFLHLSSNLVSLFHIDPYYTRPRIQSNRRQRSTSSWWCLANKQCEKQTSFFVYILFWLSDFIQTLTALHLSGNQIVDKGAQSLGDALRTNRVRNRQVSSYIFYSCLLTSYRHLLHSISTGIKSEILGQHFLAMPYEQTMWETNKFLHLSFTLVFLFHTDTYNTPALE